ncbi:UNVERIFIED_CONTAM: hypothetical protein NCL1_31142 [Trichonephila clavipes]
MNSSTHSFLLMGLTLDNSENSGELTLVGELKGVPCIEQPEVLQLGRVLNSLTAASSLSLRVVESSSAQLVEWRILKREMIPIVHSPKSWPGQREVPCRNP